MANAIEIEKMLPIYKVEMNSILSVFGDITVAYEVMLPEIFTLSDSEYEAFHQAWIKAIRILPKHSCFHKQDWYIEDKYQADFNSKAQTAHSATSFLSGASERFFNCLLYTSPSPRDS